MARTAMTGTAAATTGAVTLPIGTRKGASTAAQRRISTDLKLSPPVFLGHIVHHMMFDPAIDARYSWRSARAWPTVYRPTDAGKTWKESSAPPAFRRYQTRAVRWITYLASHLAMRTNRIPGTPVRHPRGYEVRQRRGNLDRLLLYQRRPAVP